MGKGASDERKMCEAQNKYKILIYYVLKQQNRCRCWRKKFRAEIHLDKIVEEKLIKVYKTPA